MAACRAEHVRTAGACNRNGAGAAVFSDLHHVLHALAFLQGAEAMRVNRRLVDEQILLHAVIAIAIAIASVWRYEAEASSVTEPLHLPALLLWNRSAASDMAMAMAIAFKGGSSSSSLSESP